MIGAKFWEDERRRLLAAILPPVRDAALQGMRAGAAQLGIGLNLELANGQAEAWAREYTDTLLDLLNTTHERVVGEALAEWSKRPGATMGDLVGELAPRLAGDVYRADLIAVTETTRAYANGNRMAFEEAGVTEWRWQTNRDSLVCPVCGPLNGKVVRIMEPFGERRGNPIYMPPAHPGCRCWVRPVVRKVWAARRSALFVGPN